jgi:hypothetical protein
MEFLADKDKSFLRQFGQHCHGVTAHTLEPEQQALEAIQVLNRSAKAAMATGAKAQNWGEMPGAFPKVVACVGPTRAETPSPGKRSNKTVLGVQRSSLAA